MKHTIAEEVLSTGTKGLLIDVPGSEVVNIKLFFRGGFQLAERSKYETPHLIEHHIYNGSKGHAKNGELFAELSKNGAYSNATTDPHFITYLNECAEFEYERIFDLYIDLIQRPLFPAEQYLVERENVRSELTKNLSDYSTQTFVLSAEVNYPKVWLNYQDRIDQLDSITHEDVVQHYRSYHESANASFVITGAIQANREGILAKLEELYGGLPRGSWQALDTSIGLGSAAPIVKVEDISAANFRLSWFAEAGSDAEAAAARLLSSILTGSFLSRILGKARDRGLTYAISAGASVDKYSSSLSVAGFANPDKLTALFDLIATELDDLATSGPTEEELKTALDRVVGGIKVGTQTAGTIARWYGRDYAFDATQLSYDQYFDLLMAVTPEDVQNIAAKLAYSQRHSSCHVGPVTTDEADEFDKVLKPVWK